MNDFFVDLVIPFWSGAVAYLIGTMLLRNILNRFLQGVLAPIVILLVVILGGSSQLKIAAANFFPYGVGALSTFFAYERLKALSEGIQIIVLVAVILSPLLYFSFLGLFG